MRCISGALPAHEITTSIVVTGASGLPCWLHHHQELERRLLELPTIYDDALMWFRAAVVAAAVG
jgi:hypothetical protein